VNPLNDDYTGRENLVMLKLWLICLIGFVCLFSCGTSSTSSDGQTGTSYTSSGHLRLTDKWLTMEVIYGNKANPDSMVGVKFYLSAPDSVQVYLEFYSLPKDSLIEFVHGHFEGVDTSGVAMKCYGNDSMKVYLTAINDGVKVARDSLVVSTSLYCNRGRMVRPY
jgi:hypothetical protein